MSTFKNVKSQLFGVLWMDDNQDDAQHVRRAHDEEVLNRYWNKYLVSAKSLLGAWLLNPFKRCGFWFISGRCPKFCWPLW